MISAIASQITGVRFIYWTVCSGAGQRNVESSASLAFVKGIHRWSVNSPHKGPVTRKMLPFDDVITISWFRVSLFYSGLILIFTSTPPRFRKMTSQPPGTPVVTRMVVTDLGVSMPTMGSSYSPTGVIVMQDFVVCNTPDFMGNF